MDSVDPCFSDSEYVSTKSKKPLWYMLYNTWIYIHDKAIFCEHPPQKKTKNNNKKNDNK